MNQDNKDSRMPKIFVEKEFLELVEPVFESLKNQFELKGEKISLDNILTENLPQANIYIGRVEGKDLQGKKVIAIIEGRCSAAFFEHFLCTEIIGVLRKENLQTEFEEKGKLEKILKKILREMQSSIYYDANKAYQTVFYKDITKWKLEIQPNEVKEIYRRKKYVSVFLDQSMYRFSIALRKIMEDFKNYYKSHNFADLRREIQQQIDIIQDQSRKLSVKDINTLLDKLRDISKHIHTDSIPSLLLEGETGTGKSMIADIIANEVLNDAVDVMYTKFSLVNISESIIDTELFGSREGAFTDAKTKLGRILTHVFGVIFLDEISEITPQLQAKLLLYMDDHMIRPVGHDSGPIFAPCFIIAATNKDLSQEMKEGSFRHDLYNRFKYILRIPPMRDRKEDLSFLINFVLLNPDINPYYPEKNEYAVQKISLDAIEILRSHDFPGNFRELERILKNAVNLAISDGVDIILEKHITISLKNP